MFMCVCFSVKASAQSMEITKRSKIRALQQSIYDVNNQNNAAAAAVMANFIPSSFANQMNSITNHVSATSPPLFIVYIMFHSHTRVITLSCMFATSCF